MKAYKATTSFAVQYKKGERFVITVEPLSTRDKKGQLPMKRIPIILPHAMTKEQLYKYQAKRVAKLIEKFEKLTGEHYFWY